METNFSLIERLVWKYAGERVMAEYRFHPAASGGLILPFRSGM